MFWWWFYMPQHHWPLSGAVTQDIEASLLRQARDARIEREVLRDVASYGRQLGVLTDVVQALTRAVGTDAVRNEDAEALEKLAEIAARVASIKERHAPSPSDLKRGLDGLRKRDPQAWQSLLVEQLQAQRPTRARALPR